MREKILEIIREELKIGNDIPLEDHMKPGDLKEWDSLGHMKMIVVLEAKLNMKFDYDDILEMDSIGNIVKLIENKYGK